MLNVPLFIHYCTTFPPHFFHEGHRIFVVLYLICSEVLWLIQWKRSAPGWRLGADLGAAFGWPYGTLCGAKRPCSLETWSPSPWWQLEPLHHQNICRLLICHNHLLWQRNMLQKLGKQSLEFLGQSKIFGEGPRKITRRGLRHREKCELVHAWVNAGVYLRLTYINWLTSDLGSNYTFFTPKKKRKTV